MHIRRYALLGLAILRVLTAQPDSASDREVQQHLAAARQYELVQDYAKAGEEYDRALALRPNQAAIHQSLALTLHLRNQFGPAIQEFTRALQLDPNLWGSVLFLGIDYYKTNQFANAITFLEKSISLNAAGAEPEARFWLGASQMARDRHQEAIKEYRRALELRPQDIEARFQLAKAYDQLGSALFEKIGRIEPRAAAVSLLQAERFAAENRVNVALVDYRRAITLRPDFKGSVPSLEKEGPAGPGQDTLISEADARSILGLSQYVLSKAHSASAGDLLTHLAKLEPADEGARRYIAAARHAGPSLNLPDDSWVWDKLMRARTLTEASNYPPAETLLLEVLKENARNLDALLALGRTYKRWAEMSLDQMIQINPDSSRVHQLQGEQREAKGEYDKAVEAYQEALQRQPDQAGLRYSVGNVYWKMHRYDSAELWFGEELKRNPHHALAHSRLGSVYAEQGKADDAIMHLREALLTHPEWLEARLDLGRALVLKAAYPDAIAELQKVAAADPANDRVHYILSNAFRKMGRIDDAQVEMSKYQELTRKRLDRVQQTVREVTNVLDDKKAITEKP